MKALSIRQPWAWLIRSGVKDVENRTWRTWYRGRFAIHASKSFDQTAYRRLLQSHYAPIMPPRTSFRMGGIIGTVRLIKCVDQCSSDWFQGPWGWLVADCRRCEFVPMNGRLGLFDVDDALVREL